MGTKKTAKLYTTIIIAIILSIITCSFMYSWINNSINAIINSFLFWENDNINISDTPWAETLTWQNINNETWTIIEIPEDPRMLLDYLLEYWSWWIDYIVATPTDQPKMGWSTSSNNKIMHNYLYNNRIKFCIPNTSREWYIMFITTYPINKNSNIFFWLNWTTIWWIDKTKTLYTENKNEFLFQLNHLSLIWNNNYHFYKDLSNNNTLFLNAVVWESWNKVEKIIIFFK